MLVLEQVQRIEQRNDVFLTHALHVGGLHGLGPRHQMKAHLRDHAHVALAEQAINPGAIAPLVVLPGF